MGDFAPENVTELLGRLEQIMTGMAGIEVQLKRGVDALEKRNKIAIERNAQ